jgi:hypothetical protein
VDQFGDAVDDSLGWLQESLAAAVEAQHAVEHPVDIDRARRALANCQERFHRVEQRFASDLVSYEKLKDLTGFGRSRRKRATRKQRLEPASPPSYARERWNYL